jgi:hypothetical protein
MEASSDAQNSRILVASSEQYVAMLWGTEKETHAGA